MNDVSEALDRAVIRSIEGFKWIPGKGYSSRIADFRSVVSMLTEILYLDMSYKQQARFALCPKL